MFGNDLMIKKYPYMGYSQNILEYFAIIGYQENFIPTVINSKKKYYPTILTSVTSNTDFGIIDNQLIISQVYPSIPSIIYVNKNDSIAQEKPSTSNVIYSFCFDSTDGKSKLFYTCYAFKFHEKYYHSNNSIIEEYYIPKAFCIISQYSFFSLFKYLCKNIYQIFAKKENNNLPIELLIYNIVNYIPSPINYNLYLELFSFYDSNILPIEINQLSGYPYIDFDIKEVFNILPINLFLEIYLLTIVEQSMLFFSSNLEILNMVMYIMYILNYPCNDSTYFWHIVSVSKDNLNEENKFVGKVMVSMLGVNAAYDDCIDTFAFGSYHFIVDIDNKKILLKESLDLSLNEKEDSENVDKFDNYIKDIIKDKNVDSLFLKTFIKRLKTNLESIIFKDQDNSTPKKYNGFFKNKNNYFTNKKIQEFFYDFCLNILTLFYQDNTLVSSFDKIKRVEFNIEEQNRKIKELGINSLSKSMSEGEIIFLELFRGAVKYKTYFENFLQNKDTMDVYKIALLFSDEFINLKLKDGNNVILNQISFFNIIDKLYYPEKRQTINITINNLLQLNLESLKEFFDQNNNINIKSDKKTKNKNQLINLNKKIINKYIYLLNNFYQKDEIMDLFPSLRIQEDQPIINFDRRHIIGVIINYFERRTNLISNADYLIYAIIYIFCISMSLHSYQKMLTYLENIINSFGKIKFFLRQFGNIIVQTFFKYHILHKKENKYSEMGVAHIKMYYYMLITFLKQNKIVPNEEMMAVLSKFFGKLIFQERKSFHKKEEKEIDNDTDFTISRNENFFCFMKHCFNHKGYIKSSKMIKSGIREINNSNMHIKIKEGLILKPTIVVKIKDYVYSSYFFSPKKIYKFAQTAFNEFNKSENLNFSKLKIKEMRDCITNLIQYGLEIEKLIPIEFLIYTLYLLRDYEKKYTENNKENNKENKNNDTIVYEDENTIDNCIIEEKNDINIEEKNDNNITEEKKDNNSIEEKNDNNSIEEKKNNNIGENNNNKNIDEKRDNIIKEKKYKNNIEEKNDNNNNEDKSNNNNNDKKKDNNKNEEKIDNNNNEDKNDNKNIEEKNNSNNNEEKKDNNNIEDKIDNNNEEKKDKNNNEDKNGNIINDDKNDNNKNENKSNNNNNEEKNDNNNGDDIKIEIEGDNKEINYIKKNEEEKENFKENKKKEIDNNLSEGNKGENNYLKIGEENKNITKLNDNNDVNNNKDENKDNKNEEKDKNVILKDDNKINNIIEDDSNVNIIHKNEEKEKDKINDNNNKNDIEKISENEHNNDRIEIEEKKNNKENDENKEEKDNNINIIEDKNNDKDKVEINDENNEEK